jgi:hypothetical protein
MQAETGGQLRQCCERFKPEEIGRRYGDLETMEVAGRPSIFPQSSIVLRDLRVKRISRKASIMPNVTPGLMATRPGDRESSRKCVPR